MAIYHLLENSLQPATATSFESEGLLEREDLQRILRDQVDVIAPGTMVLTEEFADWEESWRSIDLLALDESANLVVIELKRTSSGEHMELQALRYAAMVSTMTFEQAVEAHRRYLGKRGIAEDAQTRLLEFLGWDEPAAGSFAQDVRIVLASHGFSKEITSAVLWLNQRNLDIRCVRMLPYRLGENLLLDVQQIVPLPEAAEYTIRVRQKEQAERAASTEWSAGYEEFWFGFTSLAHERLGLSFSGSTRSWSIFIPTPIAKTWWEPFIRKHSASIEFDIGPGTKEEARAILNHLVTRKAEIEQAFGGPLEWIDSAKTQNCRIRALVVGGGYADRERWPEIQIGLVDVLGRFQAALTPHLEHIRDQGTGPADSAP